MSGYQDNGMSRGSRDGRQGMPGAGMHGPGPMRGGPGAMMKGEKARDFGFSARSLLSYLGKHRAVLAAVCAAAVLSTLFSIIGPMILGKATTSLFSGNIDFGYIARILLLLGSLYLVSALFSYLQGILMTGVAMKVSYSLRRDIEAKIHRLPLGYFDRRNYGEVLSHITNDVDTVTQSLNQSITQIITSVTTLAGILVMMLLISWQMTLVALAVFPLSLLCVTAIVRKSQPHFAAQQSELGHVNGLVEELYGSHVVTKAFCAEARALEEFERHNARLTVAAWKSQFLSGLMPPVTGFIGNLGYVAVCLLGGFLTVNGRLAVGNIQAFIQYVRQFNQPVTQIANISNVLQSMAAAAERIFIFLGESEEKPDAVDALPAKNLRGAVEFSRVHFGYTPDRIVIRDFSARAECGQKVAIVGPTGAGKTTIVKLLMRFYDLASGAILVDGTDIAKFRRPDIRAAFGMVLQDTWLYNATIRENIRYGRLTATDAEVIEAAKAAQVDHFVRTLPGGYDFVLNEDGTNVSRGQKQLLTIARAILADPRVLILDEATSSVDTLTEVLIQKAMDNLMSGRTSFVIAHRLSTIRNADLILVMKDGDIVEQGTHAGLLEKNGFYATLYRSQFDEADE